MSRIILVFILALTMLTLLSDPTEIKAASVDTKTTNDVLGLDPSLNSQTASISSSQQIIPVALHHDMQSTDSGYYLFNMDNILYISEVIIGLNLLVFSIALVWLGIRHEKSL
ncbi:hypothetical protein [Companilactobacillus mishanensis]|uniref:Uncharacterized protein n=1 Tax=Companilactobacillus mishanensis TaxID=2486008 RepID=A0A5P0ZHJ9_9LACO|nr:hypothetical protein [Companilactobacillus mishanensis]MQS45481.1 hypothetical protein [Companilactobacillus mishanensis]MQS52547.1 hypothetical protein [Companilactobacillus mishanensis]MQS89205.1 hypothetical protein [Companilactobacillus mishanensis]